MKDNTLFESKTGALSNGAGDGIFVGRSGFLGGFLKKRGVIAFDVAGDVSAGSVITNVTLTLELTMASALGVDETLTLHRLLADWGEGTSISTGGAGAPATDNDAMWLHTYYSDAFWAGVGGDFAAAISASQVVGILLGPYTWDSTKQMVADVQGWLDEPATNYGWLIHGNEIGEFTSKRFGSREILGGLEPILTIDFMAPECPWDCAAPADGRIATADLLALLGQWGGPGTCDVTGDGTVSTADLLKLLGAWGPCP